MTFLPITQVYQCDPRHLCPLMFLLVPGTRTNTRTLTVVRLLWTALTTVEVEEEVVEAAAAATVSAANVAKGANGASEVNEASAAKGKIAGRPIWMSGTGAAGG